jgi:hypothetical protein
MQIRTEAGQINFCRRDNTRPSPQPLSRWERGLDGYLTFTLT